MTLENLTEALNESNTSLIRLGPDAELQIVLTDRWGERYTVDRFLSTSKGNLVFEVDV